VFQKKEREMQQKLEEKEESAVEIKETYNSLQQEVEVKTKKLKKVRQFRYQFFYFIVTHFTYFHLLPLLEHRPLTRAHQASRFWAVLSSWPQVLPITWHSTSRSHFYSHVCYIRQVRTCDIIALYRKFIAKTLNREGNIKLEIRQEVIVRFVQVSSKSTSINQQENKLFAS
jgi:hypothetical protein